MPQKFYFTDEFGPNETDTAEFTPGEPIHVSERTDTLPGGTIATIESFKPGAQTITIQTASNTIAEAIGYQGEVDKTEYVYLGIDAGEFVVGTDPLDASVELCFPKWMYTIAVPRCSGSSRLSVTANEHPDYALHILNSRKYVVFDGEHTVIVQSRQPNRTLSPQTTLTNCPGGPSI